MVNQQFLVNFTLPRTMWLFEPFPGNAFGAYTSYMSPGMLCVAVSYGASTDPLTTCGGRSGVKAFWQVGLYLIFVLLTA